MADVSAIPENLYRYSAACTKGAVELQTWVRTVLTPALVDYQNGGGLCEPIDTDVARHVAAAYYTDREVRSVGMAFELAGGGPLNAPRKAPIETSDAAVESAFQQLQQQGRVPPTPTPQPGPPPPADPADLSYELWDANYLPLPSVDPDGSHHTRAQLAVLSWIEAHKDTILWEARKRNIDPKAIVAAIAWEAMVNNWQPFVSPIPPNVPYLGRHAIGPGKVHIDSKIVKQIEARGYLPRQSMAQREAILATPDGAITYIAAIMGAYADVADQSGHPSIRDNVPLLADLYQGSDLDQWQHHLDHKPVGEGYTPGNPMGKWASRNTSFLNDSLRLWQGLEPVPPPALPSPPQTPAPTSGPRPTPR